MVAWHLLAGYKAGMTPGLIYTLASSALFALATLIYSHYSRTLSVRWMNACKGLIALCCAILFGLISGSIWEIPWDSRSLPFFLSGFAGLMVGDTFLLMAFANIGPARSMTVFGFTPLATGVGAALLFQQALPWNKLLAIGLLIFCLFTLSYEKLRREGSWEVKGLAFAITGMLLDTAGILLSRWGFESDPSFAPNQANLVRLLGAVSGFIIIGSYQGSFWKTAIGLPKKSQGVILFGSICGTFLSLWLYLKAIEVGHLATVTAAAGLAPVFVAIFESIFYRQWPSKYLLVALGFALSGFYFLTQN